MSTIESLLIGNTAGLSRVDKVLRYFFFALLIGTAVYPIGRTFSPAPWPPSLSTPLAIRVTFLAQDGHFAPASGW